MNKRQIIYKQYIDNKSTTQTVCISDLREKELRNESLTEEEMQAILNFDRFKLAELNNDGSDTDFNARFSELQMIANKADFREFLKEEYFQYELL